MQTHTKNEYPYKCVLCRKKMNYYQIAIHETDGVDYCYECEDKRVSNEIAENDVKITYNKDTELYHVCLDVSIIGKFEFEREAVVFRDGFKVGMKWKQIEW